MAPLLTREFGYVAFEAAAVEDAIDDSSKMSSIQCFRYNQARHTLFFVLSWVTVGILPLLFRWFPRLGLKLRYVVADVLEADKFLVSADDGTYTVVSAQHVLGRHRTAKQVELQQLDNGQDDSSPSSDSPSPMERSLMIEYRCERYVYDEVQQQFRKVVFHSNRTFTYIHDKWSQGLTEATHQQRLNEFGPCQTDVPIKSDLQLLLDEVLNPFYFFQLFSIILWMFFEYYIVYAVAILVMSCASACSSFLETKRNLKNLRSMARYECTVVVHRSKGTGELQADGFRDASPSGTPPSVVSSYEVSSEDLVPGDLVEIHDNMTLPCDLVLLAGTAIVNESVLTGESLPVIKTQLPYASASLETDDEISPSATHNTMLYSVDDDKTYTLYAGTKVIQVRASAASSLFKSSTNAAVEDGVVDLRPVYGLVVRTGYATVKGRLIRSILFPRPTRFKFYEDSYRFIAMLAGVALIGFFISLNYFLKFDFGVGTIIIRCLDLVTITVPPALPAAMTVGTTFAMARMKKKDIFCISPPRVNVCGTVNTMCFDKTGTLTEDGLDVKGVRAVDEQGNFRELVTSMESVPALLLEALASCHSIAHVHDDLVGDPLDVKMFQATGWVLQDLPHGRIDTDVMTHSIVRPGKDATHREYISDKIGVLRRFDFSSKLQRMSVIARHWPDKSIHLHIKGSPEMVRDLCVAKSIPSSFAHVLSSYTRQGLRVLALASKNISAEFAHLPNEEALKHEVHRAARDTLEKDFRFLGFLIMENKLKPDSTHAIDVLTEANIKSIMVTGDNVLTAVSVAKQCHILPSFTNSFTFIGDIEKGEDDQEVLVWTDVDAEERLVHEDRLTAESRDVTGVVLNVDRDVTPKRSTSNLLDGSPVRSNLMSQLSLSLPPWVELAVSGRPVNVAVTGKAFAVLARDFPLHAEDRSAMEASNLFYHVLTRCKVFARMAPEQKTQLVNSLQQLNLVVGMCGDGSNDCGALKAASVGVSLSTADASIAAPFTSRRPTISSVIKILREGRAALVTSFQVFKFMALYSMIQFISVLILYSIASNLADNQFLWQDLFIIVPLAVFMSRTGAYKKLTRQAPTSSLMSSTVIVSVFGQVLLQALFQVFAISMLRNQGFYRPPAESADLVHETLEDTVAFLIGNVQYLGVVLAFSIAKPFRKPTWTNKSLSICLLVLLALQFGLILDGTAFLAWLRSLLGLMDIPSNFRVDLCFISIFSMVCTWTFEKLVLVWLLNNFKPSLRRCYLKLKHKIRSTSSSRTLM